MTPYILYFRHSLTGKAKMAEESALEKRGYKIELCQMWGKKVINFMELMVIFTPTTKTKEDEGEKNRQELLTWKKKQRKELNTNFIVALFKKGIHTKLYIWDNVNNVLW